MTEPRGPQAPRVSEDEIAEATRLLAAVAPGEWEHWWCGDEHCDCHALEFPMRANLRTFSEKPARGREVLHMAQAGQGTRYARGQLLSDETTPEIDLACWAVNHLSAMLADLRDCRAALEACRVELAGSNERGLMVLEAKNRWVERAEKAEARVAELEARAGQTWTAESGSGSTTEYHPPRVSSAAPPIDRIAELEASVGALREAAQPFVDGPRCGDCAGWPKGLDGNHPCPTCSPLREVLTNTAEAARSFEERIRREERERCANAEVPSAFGEYVAGQPVTPGEGQT